MRILEHKIAIRSYKLSNSGYSYWE